MSTTQNQSSSTDQNHDQKTERFLLHPDRPWETVDHAERRAEFKRQARERIRSNYGKSRSQK